MSSCIKTRLCRKKFNDDLRQISKELPNKYSKLKNDDAHVWAMTFGENDSQTQPIKDIPIQEGKSVTQKVDKHDILHIFRALEEHDTIANEIPSEHIKIYTDGSKSEDLVGAGSVIYHKNKILKTLSKKLINCENNTAELYAILQSIQWLKRHVPALNKKPIHVFSDSRYSIDVLTEQSQVTKNRRLVQQIQQLVIQMNSHLVLHWVPSHIELSTQSGQTRRITGNYIADELADKGAKSEMTPLDYQKTYIGDFTNIQNCVATFVYNIDKQLQRGWEYNNSQNASPSSDDIRLSDAQQVPSQESVTP